MTDIGKFLSDVNRVLKHDRQENSGKSNYDRVRDDICNLFERVSDSPVSLTDSVFAYWEKTYIYTSSDIQNEPTENNLNKLSSMLAFLSNSDENQELLTQEDWKELSELVNYEAEDLPLDVLQDLMGILVSKGAY